MKVVFSITLLFLISILALGETPVPRPTPKPFPLYAPQKFGTLNPATGELTLDPGVDVNGLIKELYSEVRNSSTQLQQCLNKKPVPSPLPK